MVMNEVNGELVPIGKYMGGQQELQDKLNVIIDELNYLRDFAHRRVWKDKRY